MPRRIPIYILLFSFVLPIEVYAATPIVTNIHNENITLSPPEGACFVKDEDSLMHCEQTLPVLQWTNSKEMKRVAFFTNQTLDKNLFYFGTINSPDDDKFQSVTREQFIKSSLAEMPPTTTYILLKQTPEFFQIGIITQEEGHPSTVTVATTTKLKNSPISVYIITPYGTENSMSRLQAISLAYITNLIALNPRSQ